MLPWNALVTRRKQATPEHPVTSAMFLRGNTCMFAVAPALAVFEAKTNLCRSLGMAETGVLREHRFPQNTHHGVAGWKGHQRRLCHHNPQGSGSPRSCSGLAYPQSKKGCQLDPSSFLLALCLPI